MNLKTLSIVVTIFLTMPCFADQDQIAIAKSCRDDLNKAAGTYDSIVSRLGVSSFSQFIQDGNYQEFQPKIWDLAPHLETLRMNLKGRRSTLRRVSLACKNSCDKLANSHEERALKNKCGELVSLHNDIATLYNGAGLQGVEEMGNAITKIGGTDGIRTASNTNAGKVIAALERKTTAPVTPLAGGESGNAETTGGSTIPAQQGKLTEPAKPAAPSTYILSGNDKPGDKKPKPKKPEGTEVEGRDTMRFNNGVVVYFRPLNRKKQAATVKAAPRADDNDTSLSTADNIRNF